MFIRIHYVVRILSERFVILCAREAKKEPKGLPAMNAGSPWFGITPQQSALLKRGNNPNFLCLGEYTFGCVAIALPRAEMAGHYYGNSFTLQKIEIFCPPKYGRRMRILVARCNENDGISLVGAICRGR
jgi:hypothetical protein